MEDPVPTSPGSTRPAPRGTAAYQRRRAVRACQVCRARRTKCDNLKPSCSFCLKTGAKCIQSPVDLSSFDPASLKILERLDELEEVVRSSALARIADEGDQNVRFDGGYAELSPMQAHAPVEAGMVLPPLSEEVMAWPALRASAAAGSPAPLHDRLDLRGHSQASPASTLAGLDEEPSRVRELLDSFFSHVHMKNPILDETQTRHMVHHTVVNGIDWSAESCLSLLILALGSIATPFGPSHDTMPGSPAYARGQSYFRAAEKRLGTLITCDDIIAPQCFFLAGVFMMCTFQTRKAWRCFVQALAGCENFRFLTLDSHSSSPSAAETLQQAIYWSAWKSEAEIRANFDHLVGFSTADRRHGRSTLYPPFFPTPPSPGPVENTVADAALRTREQTAWYFYLAEISLRRLSERLAAEMLGLRDRHRGSRSSFLAAMATNIPSYEAQTLEWIGSLPACLSFDAPSAEDDVCLFVLRGHAINIYEMIYWPFVSAFLDGQSLTPSGKGLYRDLAQRGLDHHALRLVINQPGYHHRHHGTYYMLMSCSRSALVLAAAAVVSNRSANHGLGDFTLPHGWEQSVGHVAEAMRYWGEETKDFDRVRRVLE